MKAGRLPLPALLTVLLTVLLGGVGCGVPGAPAPGPGGGADPGLRGRTFLSTGVIESGKPKALVERTTVTFRFTDDGRLLADAGCNTIAGPVDTAGGRLAVAEPGSTAMGCDAPRHAQDEWLATFLAARPSWRLDGSDLTVRTDGTTLAMRDREVAVPDLPLEGRRWTVDTILDGETAASVPVGVPAGLTFGSGTVTVEAGCNRGSGSYAVSGDTITFTGVATTKKACEPDRATVENAVLGVLRGPVSYRVDGDRLSLKQPSGKGIALRG
ncbi:MAG: META domain-containing protein [Labedaea sp.]